MQFSKLLIKESSNPVIHNLILIIVVLATLWSIILVRDNNLAKFQIILAFDAFYFIWAMIYHLVKKDLNTKIFLEYSLFAILVLFISLVIFSWR